MVIFEGFYDQNSSRSPSVAFLFGPTYLLFFFQGWKGGEQSPLHDDLGPLRGPGLSRPSWECLCQHSALINNE